MTELDSRGVGKMSLNTMSTALTYRIGPRIFRIKDEHVIPALFLRMADCLVVEVLEYYRMSGEILLDLLPKWWRGAQIPLIDRLISLL
jgi:hypothetical protein